LIIIDISPQTGAQLKAKAQAEGVSVGEYLERLLSESDSRRFQLLEFQRTMDERVRSLDAGEHLDGDEVMARLISELDRPGALTGRR
jgi:hypothetical protein